MSNEVIEIIDIELLKFAEFNPPSRTETDLRYLKESIERYGFWSFRPIICTEDYVIADGHRRVTIAKSLGITEVPVMCVKNVTLSELWAQLNVSQVISPGQVMEAYSLGLSVLPSKQKNNIALLESVIGIEGIKRLVKSGKVSPAIYGVASRIVNYCGRKGDVDFLGKTIFWMVDLQMQSVARQAIMNGSPSEIVEKAIEEKRPLMVGLSIA